MLNELYHNIGLKDYFKRYGFVNAFKRGIGRLYKSGKIDIEENCIKIK